MANAAVTVGVVLVVLGLASYAGTGRESVTALIPAFFGVPIVVMGFLGREESRRKHAMHVAATLSLVGFLGSVRGVPGAIRLVTGGEVARPAAALAQTAMAAVCLVFVILAVRSFVAARRARAA